MTRLCVVLSLFMIAPLSTMAQSNPFSSTVRSGEHGEFTRLVFQVPAGVSWAIRQTGQTRSVTFGETKFSFDLAQAFDRIGRSRLQALSPSDSGNGLDLMLACDCELRVFRDTPSYVVIDIAGPDRARPVSSKQPYWQRERSYRFGRKVSEPSAGRFSFPAKTYPSSPPEMGNTGFIDAGADRVEADPSVSAPASRSAVEISLPVLPRPVQEDGELEALEENLLQQIARALDQGLLEPASALQRRKEEPPEHAEPGENFSLVTSVDREIMELAPAGGSLTRSDICLEAGAFDLLDWETGEDVSTRIGQARSGLFGEFDNADVKELRTLVTTYLFFGFGAEAKRTMQLAEFPAMEKRYLYALADIFDGHRPLIENPFHGAHQCDSGAALWAVLAADHVPENTDKDAVMRFFSALPSHLRILLGSELSSLFVAAGDLSSADVILRAVRRSGAGSLPGIELAEADMAAAQDDHETARGKLAESVVSGNAHSAEALVRLVEEHWRTKKPLPPDMADLTAAYALELRNDPLGTDLRGAEVVALALTGRFDEAFQSLQAIRSIDGRMHETGALSRFMIALAGYSDDLTFLSYTLGLGETYAFPGRADVILPVAERLLALGFPAQSRDLLELLKGQEAVGEDGSLLLARAALALQLPHRAIIDILGNDSIQADRLRASAFWMKGSFADAAELSLQAEDPENAWRGLWHSGQMRGDAIPAAAPYQQLSELSGQIQLATIGSSEPTPLARAQALLDESKEIREKIAELRAQLEH